MSENQKTEQTVQNEEVKEEITQSEAKKENKAIEKSKEIGKKAYETAKEASKSAVHAFLKLLADPVGKQEEVMDELGRKNSLYAGIIFVLIFVLVMFGASFRIMDVIFGGFYSPGFKDYLKMFLYPLFTAGLFLLELFIVGNLITKKQNRIENHLFVTGIILFSVSIAVLLAAIFFKLTFIAVIIGIFGISSHMLILNGALTGPYGLSKRNAFIATPCIYTFIYVVYYVLMKI